MSLTPVEIRHVKLGRRLGGYDRPATDALLVRIAESFEDVWRERADLRDEIERLEGELARFRELEVLLLEGFLEVDVPEAVRRSSSTSTAPSTPTR